MKLLSIDTFATTGISRDAVVLGFAKHGLPVPMWIRFDRLQELVERHRQDDVDRIAEVVRRCRETIAVRDMAVLGTLRGSATRVRITIRELEMQTENLVADSMIERYAKGDIRTEKGKQNVQQNVEWALQAFRDSVLDRHEQEIFGTAQG